MASCESSWLIIPRLNETSRESLIAIAVLQITLDIISFVLSSSALIAIFKVRDHSFQYYIIMLSLCFTDLLNSVTNQAVYISLILLQTRGSVSCILVKVFELSALFLCFAMFILLIVAITERYVALYFPLKYRRYQSSKIVIALNIIAWISAFIVTALFQIQELKESTSIFLLVLIIIGGFWMCVVHFRIFVLAFRVRRQVAAQSSLAKIRNPSNPGLNRRNSSRTKLTAGLVASSVACYIPFLLTMAISVFAGDKCQSIKNSPSLDVASFVCEFSTEPNFLLHLK